ncbi:uncharacterized protein [Eurosta solidaginis]|uniref:uncharacterized protein n=1 Tax=Eurosta solidaginis TaxID=178769 RepID=UPI003530E175
MSKATTTSEVVMSQNDAEILKILKTSTVANLKSCLEKLREPTSGNKNVLVIRLLSLGYPFEFPLDDVQIQDCDGQTESVVAETGSIVGGEIVNVIGANACETNQNLIEPVSQIGFLTA